jgi:aconitate hydratase
MSAARWVSVAGFAAGERVDAARLPRSVRVILEAALRQDGRHRPDPAACRAILDWKPGDAGRGEWLFPVGRVLMQDASGLPLLADLAALRDTISEAGGDPARVDLATPAALVMDHAVDADHWGAPDSLALNMAEEFRRNHERYAFARWAEQAFNGLEVTPPGNGIIHQIHLERLAEVVTASGDYVRCDTVIGTDSHTTMVGGLGVVGWGVGGIEAESALLGRPVAIASPEIIGVELVGRPGPGIFASDLALDLTARLRQEGVVGAFLEFFGPGVAALGVPDRCTIANMAPEYGATMALFPVDEAVLDYLLAHGRTLEHVERVREHLTRQGLFGPHDGDCDFDRIIRFDLSDIGCVIAGPSRPDERQSLGGVPGSFARRFQADVQDGRVVLAAITSCTNTANPRAMVAAGLLARKAVAAGLRPPPWVKTVLAPGSRATTARLHALGLLVSLESLGFHVAAYGCGPCVGNTGGLAAGVEAELAGGAAAVAVLSGNRNFEGRIHNAIRAAYLASPALVVAYALAGRIDLDLSKDALQSGVTLAQLWPSEADIEAALTQGGGAGGPWIEPAAWSALPRPAGALFPWAKASTFFVRPPFFDRAGPPPFSPIRGGAPLMVLGDNVTTDHISPVGAIAADSPAARYLIDCGVAPKDLGAYAARRVNHEVMRRGTFANTRLRNRLVIQPGPLTRIMSSGELTTVADAAEAYSARGRPVVVLAGHGYGAGSARDWAAKGAALLGVRAVLARSFERIHRANLIGLGILPIIVGGPDDPWRAIDATSEVSLTLDWAGEPRPRQPVAVTLQIGGSAEVLAGELDLATDFEVRQLRHGDLFAVCRAQMLAGGVSADGMQG